MTDDDSSRPEADDALSAALRALENALATLEAKASARVSHGAAAEAERDASEHDRARLAADLDAARAREKALEQVAAEASSALGRAAAEVRAALSAETPTLGEG